LVLRKAAERSVDGFWSAIGRIIDCFTKPNAKTSSPPQDTLQHDRRML
jgi:hypothetical protein